MNNKLVKEYSFEIEDAIKYGVDEAIFLKNLKYWVEYNRANDINFHEGKYWTYNSKKAYTKIFPFWTEKQLKRIIQSLKDKKVILISNYNKSPYDRTLWYTLNIDQTEQIVPSDQMGQWNDLNGPTYTKYKLDIKPDNKPNNNKLLFNNNNSDSLEEEINNTSLEIKEKDLIEQEKELEEKKEKNSAQKEKKENKFVKPTIEEIRLYCIERRNKIDAEQFYHYYESKGWLIGKNHMKNWKSAVITWEKQQKNDITSPYSPYEEKPYNAFQ